MKKVFTPTLKGMGTGFGEFRQIPERYGFSPTLFTLDLSVLLIVGSI